jgi:hypothetical protein
MRVYHAAKHAMRRCSDQKHRHYHLYGGRGIKFLFPDRDSLIKYLLTLHGYDNPELVLDRMDNSGHYEVGNLRFATKSQSQQNKNPFVRTKT